MTRVLYTGAMGMFTAKVCSWCVSRLGGSAAWATRNTPPRCGFSSARANGTAHSLTHMIMASHSTSILKLLIHSPSSRCTPRPLLGSCGHSFLACRREGQCELAGRTGRAREHHTSAGTERCAGGWTTSVERTYSRESNLSLSILLQEA